jgi:hypothetical protein
MAAGPAEKLKTRIVRSWKQARKREIAQKNGEAGSREGNHHEADNAILTTASPIIPRRKENGRSRLCANSHYRIVAANPPNPACRIACRAAASATSAQPFDL